MTGRTFQVKPSRAIIAASNEGSKRLMEMSIVDERALVTQEQLTMEHAEGQAWEQKVVAFGNVEKMTSRFRRPKDEDFELIFKEHHH